MTATQTAPGLLLILSGPSGVGKTTIVRQVQAATGALFSVSLTTRAKAPEDVEGRDYYFLTPAEFQRRRDAGELLEWACVFENFYGTPKQPVFAAIAAGRLMILEIDVQGAIQIKQQLPQSFALFILPPGPQALLDRLRHRGRDDESVIQHRFAKAKTEIDQAFACGAYDAFLVNRDLDRAVADTLALVAARFPAAAVPRLSRRPAPSEPEA
jgi:guanylate kinase